ncbi:hypothetical protein Aph02nite_29160 [Actinoplanes philippinensis]|uniref:Uncharacterized protein n=1 Tax=Actinoplanes philippinensis TaxID=35752 RepID=A0A1I2EK39_9ACTN|nr:hypothetical protein [Actinoplanes philippinensis]GIE76966.1 hypothetical protein Aph02nite_29160 [Actinoplanes philippinensis]SFE92610.1 hypothetical protein SAMN05421541_104492 [Actinoplanes philippinensis]
MFRLERGVTGFRSGREPDLPPVAARTFRGACHEAARAADGTVEQVTESAYPRNFHSAVIRAPSGRLTVLCNDSYPWVAFAEGVTGDLDPKAFADPPSWAGTFTGAGFVVMSRRLLASPLDAVDTGALGTAERLQIDSWRPPNVGETVFNSWD